MTTPTQTPQGRQPRSALVVGVILLLLAAWNYYRSRLTLSYVLAGCGSGLLFIQLFLPRMARSFHSAWMRLAEVLGRVNSRIILVILYYAVMAPYGAALRAFGRDSLNRHGPGRPSYWKPRPATRQTKEGCERAF